MEVKIETVSKQKHKDYSFISLDISKNSFAQFNATESCPIVLGELLKIASRYPIIFTKIKSEFQISALFSLLKNTNVFIDKNGKWTGTYLPLFFKKLPFSLFKTEKNVNKILCFYSGTNLIKEKPTSGYSSFFDKNGALTEDLNSVIKLLEAIEKNKIKTNQAIKKLCEYDLIDKWNVKIKLDKEEKIVEGIYKIDYKRFKSLKKNEILELATNGALEMAYAQLMSFDNMELIGNLHLQLENNETKQKIITQNLRDKALEKQNVEKKKEMDQLVEDLFSQD